MVECSLSRTNIEQREANLLSEIKNPIFFLSNHRFPPFMVPYLMKLKNDREKHGNSKQLVIVGDISFTNILEKLGFGTIPLDIQGNKAYMDSSYHWKVDLTNSVGKILGGENKKIFKSIEIPEIISTTLSEHKNDVLICPTGVTGKDAVWRGGVGFTLKNILKEGCADNIEMVFINIPSKVSFEGNYRYAHIGSIKHVADSLDTKRSGRLISNNLQEKYKKFFKYGN